MKTKVIGVFIGMLLAGTALAADGVREVLVIAPSPYPVMARQLRVSGTVKMQAVVATNGKVKEVKVVGGHPLLAEAALNSARKWQFQPGQNETVEVITINFKQ